MLRSASLHIDAYGAEEGELLKDRKAMLYLHYIYSI